MIMGGARGAGAIERSGGNGVRRISVRHPSPRLVRFARPAGFVGPASSRRPRRPRLVPPASPASPARLLSRMPMRPPGRAGAL